MFSRTGVRATFTLALFVAAALFQGVVADNAPTSAHLIVHKVSRKLRSSNPGPIPNTHRPGGS